MDRFAEILKLLGYENNLTIHHRHNLVLSILEWAVLQDDTELAFACENEAQNLRVQAASH
ncbi:hypothetical protein SAMN06272783_4867 [Serratia sp. JKS296]|uniref:hypothetical protein n=1 Tax=Serratia sp. JKS296 TaxID=1938824 RepID=UPI000BC55960|nr:hypothetical protein [Serratia sp. JKS296]SOD79417.1 hypothetical protein SAMN06272783_4867 [Serratia sp. JKS296]